MTAAELFIKQDSEQRQKYIVPIYQRVFAWGDREVSRLICDLYEHFVVKHNEKEAYDDYYLGVITVVEGQGEHEKDLIVVDGQQRLTCLMLLGALLKWPFMDYDLLDYECRPQDKAAKNCLKNGWGENLVTGNSAMDNFFKCANSLKYKDDNGDEKGMVDELRKLEIVPSHIKMFVSVLPASPYRTKMEEQNRYFEKMNAGGRQLEPHEILKVRICSQCKQQQDDFYIWNRATDFSRVYKDYAERDKSVVDKDRVAEHDEQKSQNDRFTFLDCFDNGNFSNKNEPPEPKDGGEECVVNRESIISLPIFLLHVLALTKAKEDVKKQKELLSGWREDRLLDAFRDITQTDADVFVCKMKKYREFLDEHVLHLSYDTNRSVPSYRLGENEDADESDKQDREKLKQFQAMLFAANGGRQGKHLWLLDYYKQDKSLDALKRIDKESVPWENMESYVDGLCYQMQARWLFWRLDYLLWERVIAGEREFAGCDDRLTLDPADVKIIKNFRFHTGRSIEHLHPQSDEWSGSGDEELRKWNDEKAGSKAVRNKDMFGNLCLLTPQLNSAVGNESVGVKLARIGDKKCELQSIKMLLMYKECEGSDIKWTYDASQKHLSRMKKVLQGSYLAEKDVVDQAMVLTNDAQIEGPKQ